MASRVPLALIRYTHPHIDQIYLLHIADYVSNVQCASFVKFTQNVAAIGSVI